jgi:hypothetical protein
MAIYRFLETNAPSSGERQVVQFFAMSCSFALFTLRFKKQFGRRIGILVVALKILMAKIKLNKRML